MSDDFKFMLKINDLQKTRRYGNNLEFSESTSDHTFKVILMVDYFYQKLNLDLNYEKCIQLAIYHDFGEMDLEKDYDIKESKERNNQISKNNYELSKIHNLSTNYFGLIDGYYAEYKDKSTKEACFVNACDKLEGMIHPIAIGIPIMNHELFATYADDAIRKFPIFMPFYKEIKKELHRLYDKWNYKWEERYDTIFNQKL